MAVKTMTIDGEAYRVLARSQRPGQSFSHVIKERLGSTRTGRDLARALEGAQVSERTLDALDAIVRARRRHQPPAPDRTSDQG
jgi:predicted CopG family antitoxin